MSTMVNRYCATLVALISVLILLLTGCDGANRYGSKRSDDGRQYGGLHEATMKESLDTFFFEWEVTDVKTYKTYPFEDGLYSADDDKVYLEIQLRIKNTFSKDLAMSRDDFVICYDGMEEDEIITGYGKGTIQQKGFMKDLFTLEKGEEIKKSILYIVPDKETYRIAYQEYYDDGFEGDRYEIKVTP